MSTFHQAFEIVVGHEGGLSLIREDRGNWNSGQVGVGELKGTKYGIAAHAYPHLDIRNLTLDAARAIYERDYWNKAGCNEWKPMLALIVFDAAVNNGAAQAVKWLQGAAKVNADGIIGPVTRAAVAKRDAEELAIELHAQRINTMAQLPTWKNFGLGWSRRLARLPMQAARMEG